MIEYAELHCLSHYSFLRGASYPEELVAQAAALGYQALALTDECSMAGVVKAHVAAKQHGIKLLLGSEFRLECGEQCVVLAPSRQGYGELCGLITLARRRCSKGSYRVSVEDLLNSLGHCLLLWWPQDAERFQAIAAMLVEQFQQRLWLLHHRLLQHDDKQQRQQLMRWSRDYQLPVVAAGCVYMHCRERQPIQDLLTAIRYRQPLTQVAAALRQNAEHVLRPLPVLEKLFSADMLRNSVKIADLCQFSLDELRYEYPAELVPKGLTASRYLAQLVSKGEQWRFPQGTPVKVKALLDKELGLIAELNYEYFFLTIYDIVRFAKSRQILHQGRGSAANSAVCYCLGITEVDPTKVELLFERFISKERNEPPDIDVDFEHERREEVIQYIYQKYGRDRAALAATVICYRFKSALRDVGKAQGIEQSLLEYWLHQVDRRDREQSWQQQLVALGVADLPMGQLLIQWVNELIGFPRHLSQHVGGFIISAGPLHQLVPIENAAMAERTVIQWDKDDLEDLGLLKVDVLALGMLTAIRKCFALIQQQSGQPMGMAQVVWEQPEVYEMLCRADTVGVFQIESRAQSNMLPRLKPRCYYDLVVQIAIVRPGPIQGDMVHPYLRRRQGLEPVAYPNAALEAVLSRTLGVPLFQEQVIKLAMVAAGFSAGEADQLRRAMASWKKSGQLDLFEKKFLRGMADNGYDEAFAVQVFRQIRGFGEYGFPESHSASFALLAYVSAWLKCHYPAAFCCALLNSQPMGFYSPDQLVQDLKRHGIGVLPVDICYSDWDHKLQNEQRKEGAAETSQPSPRLRLGLRLVKGLSYATAALLVAQRPAQGFADMADFQQRIASQRSIAKDQMEALAAAGAFRSLGGHRYQTRWLLSGAEQATPLLAARIDDGGIELAAPTESAALFADYAAMGLSLERHPLAMLRQQGALYRCQTAAELSTMRHGALVTVVGLVTGRQRPGTASGVTFITLEDETGNANVVVWQATARAQKQPYLTARLLEVRGVLDQQGEVVHLIAGKLTDRSDELHALRLKSRDFC
ncbi:DNA polymerase III subunit alpha [Corallincola luteus]|uniref:Error-prone DNA polymerase n=1 Tax=Corallincola luteus TaxID=1775177 RepID=A0ABY2ALK8_9GAMM|nr:error-prone DNA polymerase [Corallincola luteus]TCI03866.1 DNA polymerase III subunit alpha [Corallincola luteus]